MFKYWKSVSWALIIAVLLFTPGNRLPRQHLFEFDQLDKIVHLFLFAVFEFILLYDFSMLNSIRGVVVGPTAIASSYAFFTEGVQYLFNIERTGSVYDLLADIVGCILGVILYRLFIRIKARSSRTSA